MSNDPDMFTSEDEVLELFRLWKKENEREYHNPEEEAKRFENFESNLNYIRVNNAKRSSTYDYGLGLNKFSDMSYEEFSAIYLGELEEPITKGKGEMEMKMNSESCENAPPSLDWRKFGAVTDVKDQGGCGKYNLGVPKKKN